MNLNVYNLYQLISGVPITLSITVSSVSGTKWTKKIVTARYWSKLQPPFSFLVLKFVPQTNQNENGCTTKRK